MRSCALKWRNFEIGVMRFSLVEIGMWCAWIFDGVRETSFASTHSRGISKLFDGDKSEENNSSVVWINVCAI